MLGRSAILAILAALWIGPAAAGADKGPNFVFIVVDALRADHLSCYGYERETSPNIDALAKSGWLFTNNKAQSSWTRSSVASIFTSRYTADNSLVAVEGDAGDKTLTEILAANGYFNIAIQTNPQMQSKWGYARGFHKYRMVRPPGYSISLDGNWWLAEADKNYFYSDAERVAEVFEEVVENNKDRRFFIFIHFMDVHEPYIPPEEHQVFSGKTLNLKAAAELSGRFIRRKDPKLRAAAVDLYDGEIHFTDRAVGKIVESLRSRGLYDDTAIIIASDHGEEFLEHGGTRHANGLYEEVLHTPLIMRTPGREGLVWEGLTRNVDIAPTILDIAGISPQWAQRDGVSLAGVVAGGEKISTSVARIYLDNNNQVRRWSAIQDGSLKYIGSQMPNFAFEELFDLESDPGEKSDLSEARPKVAHRLADELTRARGATLARPEVVVDDETKEALRAVGYLQ